MSTAPPDAFGPFRVLHQIGAGASGPVFRAYDPDHDRLVAVKQFRLDLPPERVHQLVAELEGLIEVELAHPTFVAPIATGMTGATAYLAQDYVAAESLDIAVRQGPMAAVDALRFAGQLAGALDTAAAAGIDHGVLHPRDVLLSADEARLTGLGVARALERAGVPTPVRRPYTAPERSVGSAWDRRADVFSLATLVHEMLWARRVAAMGDEAAASLTDIAGGDLARLRAVFQRALAIDPGARFDTAGEFAGALQEAISTVGRRQSAVGSRQSAASSRQSAVDGRQPAVASPPVRSEPRLSLEIEPAVDEPPALAETVAESIDVEADPVVVRGDFDLHEPGLLRYADVEPAPVAVDYSAAPPVVPPAVMDSYRGIPDGSLDTAKLRSSIAPLAFALVVGAALGFAFGFGIGTPLPSEAPSDASVAATSASNDASAAATTGSAREFTERTVAQPPPSANRAGAPPAAQPAAAPGPRAAVRPAAPPPIVGSLLVRSTPPGARVFVDGREYGRTPVTVGNLARGGHRVRVTRDGYAADERQVMITPAQRAHSITVRLSPERAAPAASRAQPAATATAGRGTGQLTVESRPTGAQVFIDGRPVGTTPLSLDDVPVGEHAVHLDLDGYRRWSSAIRIAASTRHRVAASLDR